MLFVVTMFETVKLYGILDLAYVTETQAEDVTARMLEGGVGIIQLRAKAWTENKIAKFAEKIQPLCSRAKIPFILNDFPHLVSTVGADGAHVGQEDLPVAEARRLAGEGKLIGKSTHSLAQAEAAVAEKPDYIGFGPLFATATKPDYVPIGIEDIAEVHRRVNLPIFCIGGIKSDNLPRIVEAGAKRVVIVSGILQARDISGYCRECLRHLG